MTYSDSNSTGCLAEESLPRLTIVFVMDSFASCSCSQGRPLHLFWFPEKFLDVCAFAVLMFDTAVCLLCRVGLDLLNGTLRDNKEAGVLEPAISKLKVLKLATEAAITIIRIDDMIKLEPEKKEEDPHDHM